MITRLAPSPTGALHLGNARTFLVNYLLARQDSWRVLMRVEDLDGPRVKPQAATQMLEELAWLGLEWEGSVIYQSQRTQHYQAALDKLIEGGWAYPCTCVARTSSRRRRPRIAAKGRFRIPARAATRMLRP